MNGDFSWLHFSDLHLKPENDEVFDIDHARRELLNFLESEGKSIRYVFITGDIAHKGSYDGTKGFLSVLIDTLESVNINKVFWAVGNHDIQSRPLKWRAKIINEIRCDKNIDRFRQALHNEEESALLLDIGMKAYFENHRGLLGRDVTEDALSIGHAFYPLDELNLVVLNTCLTSCDNNDTGQLHVATPKWEDLSKNIDKEKPVVVLGHHGKEFLAPNERERLGIMFKSLNADIYLCGHNHAVGYDHITYTLHDIHQFTCGALTSDAASFTFMRGVYTSDDRNISVIPYTYRGNSGWEPDFLLHSRLIKNNKFVLGRLDTLLRQKSKAINFKKVKENISIESEKIISIDKAETDIHCVGSEFINNHRFIRQPLIPKAPSQKAVKNKKHGILVAVATLLEQKVAIEQFDKMGAIEPIIGDQNISYFKLIVKKTPIYIVKSQMGTGGAGGSLLTFNDAIAILNPELAIMGGIAFGANKNNQRIGDLLLSTQIWRYNPEKIMVDGSIPRGDKNAASPHLIQMFETIVAGMTDIKMHSGLIVSGEKIVNNREFLTNKLIIKEPEMIGGDMEGAGFEAACHRKQIPWVLLKGICDWGYDKDTKSKIIDQEKAAVNSFRIIRDAISQWIR